MPSLGVARMMID